MGLLKAHLELILGRINIWIYLKVKNHEQTASGPHRDRIIDQTRSICSQYTLEIMRLGKLFPIYRGQQIGVNRWNSAEIYEQRFPALFSDLSQQLKIDSRFITREVIAQKVSDFSKRVSYDKVNWFRSDSDSGP